MSRVERIVVATLALAGAGAIAGAMAGATALAISLIITEESLSPVFLFDVIIFGGFVGSGMGALTAPIVAWALLRRVPLGKVVAQCSAGTTIGGVVGWIASSGVSVFGGLAGALIGCVVAAIRLRYQDAHRLEA